MVTLTTLEAETMEHAREPSLVMAWYGLAAVALASAFAQVDQRILILVTEPIKRSLGLSDTQIGRLNGIALSLVAAIATYPMGMLADRLDRRRLLAACVLLWSASTAVCGTHHGTDVPSSPTPLLPISEILGLTPVQRAPRGAGRFRGRCRW